MPRIKTYTELWERQPKEGQKAYEAFLVYLHMGEDRTLRKAAEKLSKGESLLRHWSSEWNWKERIRAWDNDNACKAKKKAEKDAAEMTARHINVAIFM